ncbi:MAG: class I SAM-dependent methyltransferase [Desulfobacterales bacterium]|nr:class I SAM-dependent methyltransferase [Desulfobacterales bacterium]MDJ0884480.1 class I SAM-dependent methyltransferase [Desulfobacterales bacterium]
MNNQKHLDEIHQNHRAWQNKPILRSAYRRFYQQIAQLLVTTSEAPTVEIGSGIGKIVEVIADCIRTDLFPNPWIDQVENAYRLSFANHSIANIILFDVFHHLKYPGTALDEFHRVLIPGGRVIMMEPCMSMFGLLVYGLLHHEPLGLFKPIKWRASSTAEAVHQGYYAAQGNAYRLFSRQDLEKISGWHLFYRERMSGLTYVATGGYSGPQLCSQKSLGLFGHIERLFQRFPGLFACRLLIGLEKSAA